VYLLLLLLLLRNAQPGGRLAIVDFLLPAPAAPSENTLSKRVLRALLGYAFHIPAANVGTTAAAVLRQLTAVGFTGAAATDISSDVFAGFHAFTAQQHSAVECSLTAQLLWLRFRLMGLIMRWLGSSGTGQFVLVTAVKPQLLQQQQ
jgi:hypothetical protein